MHRHGSMHKPGGRAASSWTGRIRRLLGGAAAALLVLGGVAAVPAGASSEQQQDYIVVLKDSVPDVDAKAAEHKKKYALTATSTYRYALKGYAGRMTPSEAKRVGADAAVSFVAPGPVFNLPASSRRFDQYVPFWWQRITGLPTDGKKGRPADTGGAIKINTAIIDTGIDGGHPDLNVRGGVDCTSGTAVPETPVDPEGHGTAVAGVAAAKNNKTGIIGTAPGMPLWSVRVFPFGSEELTEAGLLCALDWITSTRLDKDKTNDIEIANMSFEAIVDDSPNCGLGSDAVHMAICRSTAAGVTYVAAAGNGGRDLANVAPGNYDEVLTATAMADHDGKPGGQAQPNCLGDTSTEVGLDDQPATFSNYATLPDDRKHTVAAPGVCILSLFPGGGMSIWDGTSFSSPAVAGALALCISDKICKGSPQEVKQKFLELTAQYNNANPGYGFFGDPLRPISNRNYGYLINRSIFGHGPHR